MEMAPVAAGMEWCCKILCWAVPGVLEPWLSSLSGLSGPVGPLSSPVGGSVGLTGLTAVGAPVGWVSGPVGDLSIFLTGTTLVGVLAKVLPQSVNTELIQLILS